MFEVIGGFGNQLKSLETRRGLKTTAVRNIGLPIETLTCSESLYSIATSQILGPMQTEDDTAEFRPTLRVVGEMLRLGFFSCLHDFEGYILRLSKVRVRKHNMNLKP